MGKMEMLQGWLNKGEEELRSAEYLSTYGVMPRYPNELHITDDDRPVALQYARDIKDYLLATIRASWYEKVPVSPARAADR